MSLEKMFEMYLKTLSDTNSVVIRKKFVDNDGLEFVSYKLGYYELTHDIPYGIVEVNSYINKHQNRTKILKKPRMLRYYSIDGFLVYMKSLYKDIHNRAEDFDVEESMINDCLNKFIS